MDAIELLVNEHGLIRQYLDNLSVAAEKLESGERPSAEFFKKAMDFAKKLQVNFIILRKNMSCLPSLHKKKVVLLMARSTL